MGEQMRVAGPAVVVGAGRSWPEADRLFRTDRHWVGGDGSYSLQLGADRVLWIFADTFVSPAGAGKRTTAAVMINNSVGVQTGLDPTTASMRFCWRTHPDGRPASFFADDGEGYLWPGNAVLLDGRLLLFLVRVRSRARQADREDALPVWGFEVFAWVALVVDNPYDDPQDWRIRFLDDVEYRCATTLGFGSLWVDGEHLYAHAAARSPLHGQFLGRWSVAEAVAGRLDGLQWWCGADVGWCAESELSGAPAVTVPEPQSEFTIHRDAETGRLVWVQTDGIYAADLQVRAGERPEGPWSDFVPVFHPAEGDVDGGFVYGGKAHPEQRGAEGSLVLTYNNNSERPTGLMDDPALYFPTFVRVPKG